MSHYRFLLLIFLIHSVTILTAQQKDSLPAAAKDDAAADGERRGRFLPAGQESGGGDELAARTQPLSARAADMIQSRQPSSRLSMN